MNDILAVFHAHLLEKTRQLLLTPLPSTGLCPHFSTTSDKSTPSRQSNHAIMIIVGIAGKKLAIPIAADPVYQYTPEDSLDGGTAVDLANQVADALTTDVGIPHGHLSYLAGK